MNPKRWLHEHSLKLLAIRDTPEAIAGGVTIGFLIGFSPLFGFKTILTIFVAWVTGCNILAAVLASALHDILIPIMGLLYVAEYDLGFWLLSRPHHWPRLGPMKEHLNWHYFIRHFAEFGWKALVGWALVALPLTPITYFLTRRIVARHHLKRKAQEEAQNASASPGG
jgi:uncharacterized protein (DUF2062 family)